MPLELEITPTDGAKIKLDEATILPEEQNGSEADGGEPVSLGLLTDNKNGNGEAVYKMATGDDKAADNDDFEITPNGELRYIGSDSGDFETATKKSFAISIARYNNQADADDPNSNPQIVSVTINLQDQTEDLSIIPAENAPLTIENEELFLNEGIDGSGDGNAISLGKIDDGIDASGVTYNLTTHTELFEITGDEIFYKGPLLDYEDGTTPKQYTLNIERIREGITDDDPLIRTINLRNLNDTAPVIEAYLADSTTAIDTYKAVGNVGGNNYAITLDAGADGQTFTFNFVRGTAANSVKIAPITEDGVITGFTITTGTLPSWISIAEALTHGTDAAYYDQDPQALTDFATWKTYNPSIEYVGSANSAASPNGGNTLYATSTLTARLDIEVNKGTEGTIANFASTDPDGNLNPHIFADLTGTDAALFNFDKDTGDLSFKTPPNADNIYDITITVSDGQNTTTYGLFVVVGDFAGAGDAAPTAAESVPDSDKNGLNKEPQKWEPSPFDNIFDDDDPFGPIGGGGGGDGVL